ncbi:hypothetical protein DIPPA_13115 [Diplonema papillatum]|nr:hypothetical protein DIPPA_13115 [Diplonema papillatum]
MAERCLRPPDFRLPLSLRALRLGLGSWGPQLDRRPDFRGRQDLGWSGVDVRYPLRLCRPRGGAGLGRDCRWPLNWCQLARWLSLGRLS